MTLHGTLAVYMVQANKLRQALHDKHSKFIRQEFDKYVRVATLCRTRVVQQYQKKKQGNTRRDPVPVFEMLVDREGRSIPLDETGRAHSVQADLPVSRRQARGRLMAQSLVSA